MDLVETGLFSVDGRCECVRFWGVETVFGLGPGICGSGWTVMARGSFVVGKVLLLGLGGDDAVFDFGELVEFVETHLMLGAAGVFDGAGVVFVD